MNYSRVREIVCEYIRKNESGSSDDVCADVYFGGYRL